MISIMQQSSSEKQKTTITLHGPAAFAEGAICDLIVSLLEHAVRRFLPGGPLGYHHHLELIQHFGMDDGRLIFSAGLVPRIRRHLERHGYMVEIDDRTLWGHLQNADHQFLQEPDLAADDVRLLNVLAKEPRGQILVQRFSDIGRHIALFARLFRDFNIYIVARNKNRVQQLVQGISQHADRPVTRDSRTTWSHNPRMFVGTMQLFHHSMSDGFHIVIFTDVESILATRTANLPEVWQDGTWYAFLEVGAQLTDYQHFRLEEICGPVIFSPIENNPLAKVNVVFLDVDHEESTAAADKGLTRKRALFWHSPSWNQMIAKTAMALAQYGLTSPILQKAGVPRLPDSLRKGYRQTVSILVESCEHGCELLTRLPQWELLTINAYTSCIPLVDHQQIATFAYADRWGINTDILIRADGGSGWPLSSGFPRLAQHQDDLTLLVDFIGATDETAIRDTQSRRAMYEQLDWNVVTMDSELIASGTEGGKVRATKRGLPLDHSRLMETQKRSISAGQLVQTGH